MHPVLIKVFGFPVHSYGLLIALGFLLSAAILKKDAVRAGLPGDRVVDLAFWGLLVGMLGSRLLYVFTRLDYFSQEPLEIFFIWTGGLVFWAGPIANIPFFIWYCEKFRLSKWKVLDLSAGVIPLAHAFGRLGCLAAGCCYGKPFDGWWSIKLYSAMVEPALHGVSLHPVQLYESILLLTLFGFLRWFKRRARFEGQIFLLYFMLYAIIRSIVEMFRGDQIRGFVVDQILSTSQFIAIIVILVAGGFYRFRARATRR